MTSPSTLRESWNKLCHTLGIAGCDRTFDELVRHYTEPNRAYHNLTHIAECLAAYQIHALKFQRPEMAAFALFAHDIIYDPLAKDNEARSADWAAPLLAHRPADQDHVRSLIMATRHLPMDLPADESLVADIDMSILAADPARYRQYAQDVRTEYAAVPPDAYRTGRATFLRGLLDRPRIFRTQGCVAGEPNARKNIESELAALK